jgi:uncharacterized RDD family membrane protein YckC
MLKTILAAALLVLANPPPAHAAQPPERPEPPRAERPEGAGRDDSRQRALGPIRLRYEISPRPDVFRVGQDYTLNAGDTIDDVVVISGITTIDGHVDSDVQVIFGEARIGSAAVIDGDLIVVGGSLTIAPGAQVRNDLVAINSTMTAPPDFVPGGEHVVIGPGAFGGRFDGVFAWITRGLLWGRLIVPSLPWVWGVVGLLFLIYLSLNLVFGDAVRACATTLAARPMTAFLTGLLTLLLTGPLCFLLAISVAGIAIIPLVLCALAIAWIIGKIGVARWIGIRVAGEDTPPTWLQAGRSFIIGFAIICVAFLVPVIGLLTWGIIGSFGLGSAVLAFRSGYRQENPRPPKVEHLQQRPDATVRLTPDAANDAWVRLKPDTTGINETDVNGGAAIVSNTSTAAVPGGGATAVVLPPAEAGVFPHAEFRDRLGAFVLDGIVVVILSAWFVMPACRVFDIRGRFGPDLLFAVFLAYRIAFWTWRGTTVGGIICQLRIVKANGTRLEFVDALVRGFASILSIAALGLGCLWVQRDPERQAWHDRIAGTYVVKVPRNYPI